MAKSSDKKLAYQASYQKSPAEVEKRVARNKARRHAIAEGKVSVGDGREVDHKHPLRKGGAATDGNTRVVGGSTNAGWRAGKKGYDK